MNASLAGRTVRQGDKRAQTELPVGLTLFEKGKFMKLKHVCLAVLATAMSGAASAAVNYAEGFSWVDLADMTFTPYTGGPVTETTNSFTGQSVSDQAQDDLGPLVSVSGLYSATADTSPSDAYATSSVSLAPTTLNNLSAFASATNGQATAMAGETLHFTLTGTGTVMLSIPYTLSAVTDSTNIVYWSGTSSADGGGIWSSGAHHGSVSDGVVASTGGDTNVSTSDYLNFLFPNKGHTPVAYTLNLTATAMADFSGPNPTLTPTPELPAPVLLSLGLMGLLFKRRARKQLL